MRRPTSVLVAGAGPTGLTLALQAHDHGAHVRIVDRRPEAFRPSRALILHPRTLEVLRPLGVSEALLARADVAPEGILHLGSREVRMQLADLALPDTAFPHLSLVRQMDVETVLAQALAERGVQVERGTELVEVWDGVGGVRATLRTPAGMERADWDYVAGCDGPASTVRTYAGIGWYGGAYGEEVVLADVELDGDLERDVSHVVAGRRGLVFVFALGERATWRLMVTRPAGNDPPVFGEPGPTVPCSWLQAILDDAGLEAQITALVWSGQYRLQHRLACRFGKGRLFLAGDAAHAFSPATGQGMNTGIQDAANLGWKLAFAPSAAAPGLLLDSYDLERRPVARQTLALTHLVFWSEASTRSLPSLLRSVAAPLATPMSSLLLGRPRLVAEAIRLLSQLRVAYRNSPLSVEGTPRLSGEPHAGQRLPDMTVISGGQHVRLHCLLARPGVHVLLQRDANRLEGREFGPRVAIHRLTSMPGEGLMAIRPDGYIGFRCATADASQLRVWLARVGGVTSAGPCDLLRVVSRAKSSGPATRSRPVDHLAQRRH